MESEWRVFLREHAPKLYEMMMNEVRHDAQWRDDKITTLEGKITHLKRECDQHEEEWRQQEKWKNNACVLLKETIDRARGTKRCQLCGISYDKAQSHDIDCPVKKYDDQSHILPYPEIKESVVCPKVLEFEAIATNGLKIRWDGLHRGSIEAKDGDDWKPLKHVRNVNISIGVDHVLPVVTLEYYIFEQGVMRNKEVNKKLNGENNEAVTTKQTTT